MNKDQTIIEIIHLARSANSWNDLKSKLFNKVFMSSGASAGFLMVCENNILSLEVAKGLSPSIWKKASLNIKEDIPGGVAQTGKARIVQNLNSLDPSSYLFSNRYCSAAVLPLVAHGHLRGVVSFFSPKKNGFDPPLLKDLEEITEVVALVMPSFHYSNSAHKIDSQAKEIKVLTDTLRTLSHSFGFSEMLYTVLATAANFTSATKAAFAKYDKQEKDLIIQFPTYGLNSDQVKKLQASCKFPCSKNNGASTENLSIHEEKIGDGALCTGNVQVINQLNKNYRQYLERAQLENIKSVVAVPLKSKSQTIGVFYLFSEAENNFDKDKLMVLEKIAHAISTPIAHWELDRKTIREKVKTDKILGTIREGVCVIDKNQKVIFLNQAAQVILGVSAEKVSGKSLQAILDLFKGRDVPKVSFLIKHALNSDIQSNIPVITTIKNNLRESLSVSVNISSLKDDKGEIIGTILNIQDISRESAYKTMQDTLIAVAAHELRNPITGIKGYLELVLSGDTGKINQATKEALEEARDVTDHLKRLVNDILYVSEIEENKIYIRSKKFNIDEVVSGVLKDFSLRLKEKKLQLSLFSKGGNLVKGDMEKTKEIIANLVDNAVKYTPRGNIQISIKSIGGFVEMAVKDTGIGMTSGQLKKLFSKFYRVKHPLAKNITGTGLGLWITKHLVEKQGGKILVASEPSRGSVFKFTLPAE